MFDKFDNQPNSVPDNEAQHFSKNIAPFLDDDTPLNGKFYFQI